MTCTSCTTRGVYDLSCVTCAGRYLARVVRNDRNREADRLCSRYGHDRAALLAAFRQAQKSPR